MHKCNLFFFFFLSCNKLFSIINSSGFPKLFATSKYKTHYMLSVTFDSIYIKPLSYNLKKIIFCYAVKRGIAYFTSLTCRPGGSDCFNFSAFSLSETTSVYRKREQRILNLVLSAFFFILTARASFLRALMRKSLTSLISLGIYTKNRK